MKSDRMRKGMLERNFSRVADSYDRYCRIQRFSAGRLVELAGPCEFGRILEIGCGTGNFTGMLAERYPLARIDALDISDGMIGVARRKLKGRARFIKADAESFRGDGRYDLISSNGAFQWFSDVKGALGRLADLLGKNGVVLISTFGPRTFRELDWAVREYTGGAFKTDSKSFPGRKELGAIAGEYFSDLRIEEETVELRYGSLRELLESIRSTGTRGRGMGISRLWTEKAFSAIESAYIDRYGSVNATYEILFFKGVL